MEVSLLLKIDAGFSKVAELLHREQRLLIAIRHKKSTDVILLRVAADTLEQVNLSDAYLPGANLAGCRCGGAVFQGATLSGAILCGTDLRHASFQSAVLAGADLRGANLTEANLFGADLSDALLDGADLQGANLSLATLTNARLAEVQLAGAMFDDQTVWPDGFDPVAEGAVLLRRAG